MLVDDTLFDIDFARKCKKNRYLIFWDENNSRQQTEKSE